MADFSPIPLRLQPGLQTEVSESAGAGAWVDGDNIRFVAGFPERIGGWEAFAAAPAGDTTPVRGMIAWADNANVRLTAFGTANGLYVFDGQTVVDITPVGLAPGPVDAVGSTPPRIWSLAVWGEDLLAVARDEGTLVWWDRSVGGRAAAVAGAPTGNLGVIVSEERHAMLYGAGGDRMRIKWCHQEDLTVWNPSPTTTAGGYRLDIGTEIMGAAQTGRGIVFVTDSAAYVLQYAGADYVYSKDVVGTKCGAVGPLAIVGGLGGAVWLGHVDAHVYDGAVQTIPCTVRNRFFDLINVDQQIKSVVGQNADNGETFFFFPRGDEIDGYALHGAGGWSLGSMARTSWLDATEAHVRYPVAGDAVGKLWLHERVQTGAGGPIPYFLHGSIGAPEQAVTYTEVRKVLPDFQRLVGSHSLTLLVRESPMGAIRQKGPYALSANRPEVPMKARGRLVSIRLEGSDDFRLGTPVALVTGYGGKL